MKFTLCFCIIAAAVAIAASVPVPEAVRGTNDFDSILDNNLVRLHREKRSPRKAVSEEEDEEDEEEKKRHQRRRSFPVSHHHKHHHHDQAEISGRAVAAEVLDDADKARYLVDVQPTYYGAPLTSPYGPSVVSYGTTYAHPHAGLIGAIVGK